MSCAASQTWEGRTHTGLGPGEEPGSGHLRWVASLLQHCWKEEEELARPRHSRLEQQVGGPKVGQSWVRLKSDREATEAGASEVRGQREYHGPKWGHSYAFQDPVKLMISTHGAG